MLLTVVIALWVIVVVATLVYAGIRGLVAYRAGRSLQRSLEPHMETLKTVQMAVLTSRSEELQRRLAALQAALAHLNAAIAALRVLLDAWRTATRPFSYLRGLVHR